MASHVQPLLWGTQGMRAQQFGAVQEAARAPLQAGDASYGSEFRTSGSWGGAESSTTCISPLFTPGRWGLFVHWQDMQWQFGIKDIPQRLRTLAGLCWRVPGKQRLAAASQWRPGRLAW